MRGIQRLKLTSGPPLRIYNKGIPVSRGISQIAIHQLRMTTFSEPTFNHTSYATFRPSYPSTLFTYLQQYHNYPSNSTTTILDLGCGPGTVTRPLSTHFPTARQILGIDPSPGMLKQAGILTPSTTYPTIEYRLSPAEDLHFITPSSVDIVVSAQAAHWFDSDLFWGEMARIVRPGGTVACWGYKDCVIVGHPIASKIFYAHSYGKDKWGPYWSQPGRRRVQGRMRSFGPKNGSKDWKGVERWEYEPQESGLVVRSPDEDGFGSDGTDEAEGEETREVVFGKLVKKGEVMLKKRLKLEGVEEYVRTFSAVHKWLENHPEEKRRKEGGEGDTVDELFDEMARAEGWWGVGEEEGKLGKWREVEVDVEWGHGMVCVRKSGGEMKRE